MTQAQSSRSWIESANDAATHFPLRNRPYGVFSHGSQAPRVGVAIGESIVDLSVLDEAG
ncbi:hypothetical protein ABTF39_20990, partial [Acinetobacter baumannii]